MKFLPGQDTGCIRGLILDIDNTVYPPNKEYRQMGDANEIMEVATILNITPKEAGLRIRQTRSEIAARNNGNATMTESVYALGVTPLQWDELRCRAWKPEEYFREDPSLRTLVLALAKSHRIAFATNSPQVVGRRIIDCIIGLECSSEFPVFGPVDLQASKPNPDFFRNAAAGLSMDPACCISVGDREFSDGPSAIEAGYAGAVIVPNGRDETIQFLELLLAVDGSEDITFTRIQSHATEPNFTVTA